MKCELCDRLIDRSRPYACKNKYDLNLCKECTKSLEEIDDQRAAQKKKKHLVPIMRKQFAARIALTLIIICVICFLLFCAGYVLFSGKQMHETEGITTPIYMIGMLTVTSVGSMLVLYAGSKFLDLIDFALSDPKKK